MFLLFAVVCRHFLSPTGCRLGNQCNFRHVKEDKKREKKSRWSDGDGPPKLDGPTSSPTQQNFDPAPPKLKQEGKQEPNNSPLVFGGPPKLQQEVKKDGKKDSSMSPPR